MVSYNRQKYSAKKIVNASICRELIAHNKKINKKKFEKFLGVPRGVRVFHVKIRVPFGKMFVESKILNQNNPLRVHFVEKYVLYNMGQSKKNISKKSGGVREGSVFFNFSKKDLLVKISAQTKIFSQKNSPRAQFVEN